MIIPNSYYWQLIQVRSLTINFSCNIFNIYGLVYIEDKKALWDVILGVISSLQASTMGLARDFNATLELGERKEDWAYTRSCSEEEEVANGAFVVVQGQSSGGGYECEKQVETGFQVAVKDDVDGLGSRQASVGRQRVFDA